MRATYQMILAGAWDEARQSVRGCQGFAGPERTPTYTDIQKRTCHEIQCGLYDGVRVQALLRDLALCWGERNIPRPTTSQMHTLRAMRVAPWDMEVLLAWVTRMCSLIAQR